jgi:hypothetical protein
MCRFVIANHSPRMFAKTDLCRATRERCERMSSFIIGQVFSGPDFEKNYRNIGAISLDSSVTEWFFYSQQTGW